MTVTVGKVELILNRGDIQSGGEWYVSWVDLVEDFGNANGQSSLVISEKGSFTEAP